MNQTTSPVIPKLDFPEAIREIMNGKKVRRELWPAGEYGILQNGWLMIVRATAPVGTHRWEISDGDFNGRDWTVV